MEQGAVETRRTWGDHARRAVASVLALAVLGYWFLYSSALAMFACDDTCSTPDEASWWGYGAQFGLAALGVGFGLVAIVAGFTTMVRPYRIAIVGALACGLAWVVWTMGSGSF